MAASSQTNSNTLPQGFSVYQPALGAQLQFLPAIGNPQLDELINAYVPGPASTQEKRATVSLDFLEYAHLTGQTFKFYPVYSLNAPVGSPATDSGYGSSFNASPVMPTWDFSQISAARSPTSSHAARRSPKTATPRHQATDFSNLPGMKIMTKDGRDVTNSASRGSKTKEQRDHAHLMRIIKACDSCRRKKIRCDPSHKKRAAAHPQPQVTSRSVKKAKAVTQAAQIAVSAPPPIDIPVTAPAIDVVHSFAHVDLENFAPSLSTLEPWEEFIEYPPADLSTDYDFFYDPNGYFSPEPSSSVSAYSTKPVTPTSQQDTSASYSLPVGESALASLELPFNQTESIHDYVDFNLFSPESSFSEDDHMVPIELARHPSNQSQQPNPSQSDRYDQSPSSSHLDVELTDSASGAASVLASQYLSGVAEGGIFDIYHDPGTEGESYSPSSSSPVADTPSHSLSSTDEMSSAYFSADRSDNCQPAGDSTFSSLTGINLEIPPIAIIERVPTFAGLRGSVTPYAPCDGANSIIDHVAKCNVSATAQMVSRDVIDSSAYAIGSVERSEDIIAIAAVAVASNDSTSSIGVTAIANTHDALVPSTSTSEASAASSGLGESSSGPVVASSSVTSGQSQSLIRRDTASYATTLVNTDSSTGAELDDTCRESAISSYDDKYSLREVDQSSVSLEHGVSEHDLTPAMEPKTQTFYSPSSSQHSGVGSLIPLVISAAMAMWSGFARFTGEQCLATIILDILFVAIASWLCNSTNAPRTITSSQWLRSLCGKAIIGRKHDSLIAGWQNRLGDLQSRATNSTLSVDRLVLPSRSLIAV